MCASKEEEKRGFISSPLTFFFTRWEMSDADLEDAAPSAGLDGLTEI